MGTEVMTPATFLLWCAEFRADAVEAALAGGHHLQPTKAYVFSHVELNREANRKSSNGASGGGGGGGAGGASGAGGTGAAAPSHPPPLPAAANSSAAVACSRAIGRPVVGTDT